MTTTYSRNGDGTGTFSIDITGEQVRFEEILYNFGLSIYGEHKKAEYDAITTQQQLNLIETFLIKVAKSKDKAVQQYLAELTLNLTDPF